MNRVLKLAGVVERLIIRIGQAVAWLVFCMAVVTCLVAVLRYGFSLGWIWLQETITWMHAAVFLLAAGYTLARDGHVRVDIFYRNMAPKRQALVNLGGCLIFLLPLAACLVAGSLDYVTTSWLIHESSREAGGLIYPFPSLLKTLLPITGALLGLQALVISVRCSALLLGVRHALPAPGAAQQETTGGNPGAGERGSSRPWRASPPPPRAKPPSPSSRRVWELGVFSHRPEWPVKPTDYRTSGAFQLPEEKAAQFTNDAAGFRKLIAWIGKQDEPTGPYHRDFEQALLKAKLPMAGNPGRRGFAQATGQRAKTDQVDARMLACMAATLALRPTSLASKCQRALSDLQTGKNKLIRDRTAELNRGDHLRDPLLKQQHQTHLNMLNRHRRGKIQELIAAEPTLARKAEIIASIPGLASNTAANLLAEMPELGTLRNPAAVSLAGLAPIARESGAWQGRRFIQGGRHPVRRLLYMPAVAAIRCNPDMKPYRTLAERGQGRGRGHHAQTPDPGQR